MASLLTDLGEEYVLKTALPGVTLTIGLYNDGTDAITDSEDVADITTEPSDGNYSQQTLTVEVVDNGGDWEARNDAEVSFGVSNTTGTVDSYFIIANFQAEDTGDGSATDHLIITGALSQSRDLSQLDTLNIDPGTAGISLS